MPQRTQKEEKSKIGKEEANADGRDPRLSKWWLFKITVNTNQKMSNHSSESAHAFLEDFKQKIRPIFSDLDLIKQYLVFYNPIYSGDEYENNLKTLDVSMAIEIGPINKQCHCHVALRLNAYHNIKIDMVKLGELFKQYYGTNLYAYFRKEPDSAANYQDYIRKTYLNK